MNDSLYEDYMRGVLGYQGMNSYPNTYNMSYDNYERYDPYAVHTMSPIASNTNARIRKLLSRYI